MKKKKKNSQPQTKFTGSYKKKNVHQKNKSIKIINNVFKVINN